MTDAGQRAWSGFLPNGDSERTVAGLTAAQARGRTGGRPFKITPAKVRVAMAAMGQKETKVGDHCKELGITRQTLYRTRETVLRRGRRIVSLRLLPRSIKGAGQASRWRHWRPTATGDLHETFDLATASGSLTSRHSAPDVHELEQQRSRAQRSRFNAATIRQT